MAVVVSPAQPPLALIQLQGDVTGAEYDTAGAVAHLIIKQRTEIVIDCEELTYVDAEALAGLTKHLYELRERGGDIRFCCVPSLIASSVLDACGEHAIQVFPDRLACVRSYARQDLTPQLSVTQHEGPEGQVVLALEGVADAPLDGVAVFAALLEHLLEADRLVLDARQLRSAKDEKFVGKLMLVDFRFAARGGDLRVVAPERGSVAALAPGDEALFASYTTLVDALNSERKRTRKLPANPVTLYMDGSVHVLRLSGRVACRSACARTFGLLEELRPHNSPRILVEGLDLRELPLPARHALATQLRGLLVQGARVAIVPSMPWFLPSGWLDATPDAKGFAAQEQAIAWLER